MSIRVKFLTSISSSEWGAYGPGEEGEIPDKEAKSLISAGIAEAVGKGPKQERATKKGITTRRAR